MENIREIIKQNKFNLIEISILIRLRKEHPNMVLVQDLIDDESFFNIVINDFDSLVRKGVVKVEGTKSGVVCGIV